MLDRSDLSMMNPGKKVHVYVGKSNGERKCERKRYLLWPYRDLLNILNTPENDSYVDTYGEELLFSALYRFLKKHKQYTFNKNIPQNACLCKICEKPILLSKGVSSRMIFSLEDGLELWNSRMERLKKHIFAISRQQSKISHFKTNLKSNEILLQVDYRQNYKS